MARERGSERAAQGPNSRREAAASRRRQQRAGKFRLIGLITAAVALVGGVLSLLLVDWGNEERPASAAPSTSTFTERPFTLAPGSVIITSDPSETSQETIHSSTPRPTPTRDFAAPRVDAVGKATFHVLQPAPGDSGRSGRVIKYSVSVEDGVAMDEAQANNMVRTTLTDPRGWEVVAKVHFVQVGPDQANDAEMRIIFASPGTTNDQCFPINTMGEYSCQPGGTGKIVLNVRTWLVPIPSYKGQRDEFESMLINHSVGYVLGKPAASCPAPGRPAPVMQPQTVDMEGCLPNAWPVVA